MQNQARLEHFQYLDSLRESAETNMYGAPTHLALAFPELNRNEARSIVKLWMDSYNSEEAAVLRYNRVISG